MERMPLIISGIYFDISVPLWPKEFHPLKKIGKIG
jgi:hypothetical protein